LSSKPRSKFGVHLDRDLAEELEELVKQTGVESRSKIIQEALRLFLAERSWIKQSGPVAGVLVVLYDHNVNGVDEALTDIQHHYLDVVAAAMHVHLTEDLCLLAVGVRGDSQRIGKLVAEIESIRGVKLVRSVIVAAPISQG